ncbi:MAG: acetylornithine/succinylornithine family transaminase [Bacteroidetes bacterium]|nr:acetylornithine/succinylornithine family transaminase [Bacteroidota bacterium]
MNNKDLFEREKNSFLHTYKRTPIEIKKGEGVYLIDKNNNRYLDFMSGLGVNALGHNHPKVIEAVTNQINKFSHISNYFITDVQTSFAKKLLEFSDMDKLFLANSGTEAIEGTIKLIRMKFGSDKKIFSLTNSFHGRTYGSLSLTAREKHRKGFEPLLPNIGQINFDDINDLESKIDENTAAVFLEFLQGEGGVQPVSKEFVSRLFSLKEKFNFLVIADEIQSGVGRTGKNFAFQHYNVKPDIVVVAKAIGGGLPLGSFMVKDNLKDVLEFGKHGTTFGGNPVACAAGIAVFDFINENKIVQKVEKLGDYFFDELNKFRLKYTEFISKIRGKGFMIGIEMKMCEDKIVEQFRDKKILVNLTAENVIRLLPPLITEQKHLDIFLNQFDKILTNLTK